MAHQNHPNNAMGYGTDARILDPDSPLVTAIGLLRGIMHNGSFGTGDPEEGLEVQGTQATGETYTDNPVVIGGINNLDATIRRLLTDTDGKVFVRVVAGDATDIIGAVDNAAVVTDTSGTVNGKLRGLVKWAFERMPAALTGGGNLKVAVQEALPAGTNYIGKVAPFTGMVPITDTLVDVDEQIDQNDYGASVGVSAAGQSGELLSLVLYSHESGSGAIMVPDCEVYIFNSDPAISFGATSLSTAAWDACIGMVEIDTADWRSDANGGMVSKAIAIPFYASSGLWFALKNLSATAINSAAGDEESITFQAFYRRDS